MIPAQDHKQLKFLNHFGIHLESLLESTLEFKGFGPISAGSVQLKLEVELELESLDWNR